MNPRRAIRPLAVVVVVGGMAAATMTPSSAITLHPIRYTTPTGSGVLCTSKTPCSLATAINSAPAGADIVIEPGTYGSAATPLTTGLSDITSGGSLTISGQAGSSPPVIYDDATTFDFLLSDSASSLSNVTVIAPSDSGSGIATTGSVSHVTVVAGDAACIVAGAAVVSESVCDATGTNGIAVDIGSNGMTSSSPELRNVTAVALKSGGIGLDADANMASESVGVAVQNSILLGGDADIIGGTSKSGASVRVYLHNSDYRTVSTDTGDTALRVIGDATDITGLPQFVNALTADFVEKGDSPTIDRGAASTDATDLVGTPRSLGSAPDIGAFEFQPKPALGKLSVVKRSKTSVKVSIKVNPEDLLTSVTASASHAQTVLVSKSASAGSGFAPKTVTLTIHGLHVKRKYTVKVTAKNKTGSTTSTTTSTTKSVTTR